jgi:hypothetical protein
MFILYQNKRWLYEQYILKRKSVQTISNESGLKKPTLYKWIKKLGIPTRNLSESHKGIKPNNYRGWHWNGKYLETYIGGKKILLHRLEMEKKLGRKLLPTEVVHHINHITTDNRPENLQVFSSPGRHSVDGHGWIVHR